MNNVLFVMKYPTIMDYNLKVKFDGQMEAVKNLGKDVDFIKWDGDKFVLSSSDSSEIVLMNTLKMEKEKYFHSVYFIELMKAVQIACKLKKYDVLYIRSMPLISNPSKLFKQLKCDGIKIVWEIPTYPLNETPANMVRRFAGLFTKFNFNRVCKYIDCFTVIGENIPDVLYGKRTIEIENGVGINRFMKKRYMNFDSEEIHIIALAAMSYWQGFDRMINSIYADETNLVKLHLVGPDGDGSLSEYKDLVSKLHLEDRVLFHGPMYGDDLDRIFNMCDIGLGALGMYRKDISVASTLKVTEYMARGIPFIYGYDDSRLTGEYEFCLKFSNDESLLNLNKVIDFVKKVKGNDALSEEMRNFVATNMSWEKQFSKVFLVLEQMR